MNFEDIKTEIEIPYYEETQKRSFVQKLRKIKNTRILFHRWRGVHIGQHVYIGLHCHIDNLYPDYIYIGDNASINSDSMILTHFNPMKRFAPIVQAKAAPVVIKEGAILAVRSTVLPGVTIGKNAIISAGSVVEKDISDYSLVRGNPAKVITNYKPLMTE